jgi:hypothetical protein
MLWSSKGRETCIACHLHVSNEINLPCLLAGHHTLQVALEIFFQTVLSTLARQMATTNIAVKQHIN